MQDAWRAYLEMALGLTEAPRKKAQKVAADLANRGGATAAQLQGLVEDLMSAGMANREALTNIVRYEVDKALGVVGLATAEEVSDLTTRVRDLERQLREAQARATAAEAVGAAGGSVAREAAGAAGGIGGDRLNQPAPMPGAGAPTAKAVKKAMAKKAVKAPQNRMPEAATTPPAPAKKAAAAKNAAAAPPAPAKKTAKKAARAALPPAESVSPSKALPTGPAGTAEPPVAPVRDAAAATELPTPASPSAAAQNPSAAASKAVTRKATAKKAAAKKAPAKKAGASTPTDPTQPEV
jgi:polyhydroxyalkanoate synthesis regulator phasin